MKDYDYIPLTVETHAESWYSWPQTFIVPKGWWYLTYPEPNFLLARGDLEIELCCTGDWLEIVNDKDNIRIRHVIV